MAAPIRLSAHKNKVEARRKRDLAREMKGRVATMVRSEDIRAYAVIGIAANGSAHALWDTGAILPLWAFADTVATVLREDIRNTDVADDWRPTLTVKGTQES